MTGHSTPSRRTVLRGAALAPVAGLGLAACSPGGETVDAEPTAPVDLGAEGEVAKGGAKLYKDHNVVLVSFDALQAAHVGCLGNPRPGVTPTLDALASESFSFTQYYSVASWTVPSTMSWFTGVYPSEHGLTNKFAVFSATEQRPARLGDKSPGLVTLAEALKRNGYATKSCRK